ncbi:hypothetical protein J3E68DRAFT_410249 [Trichoderma sp. SZMC 28012]
MQSITRIAITTYSEGAIWKRTGGVTASSESFRRVPASAVDLWKHVSALHLNARHGFSLMQPRCAVSPEDFPPRRDNTDYHIPLRASEPPGASAATATPTQGPPSLPCQKEINRPVMERKSWIKKHHRSVRSTKRPSSTALVHLGGGFPDFTVKLADAAARTTYFKDCHILTVPTLKRYHSYFRFMQPIVLGSFHVT